MNSFLLLSLIITVGLIGPLLHRYINRYSQWEQMINAFIIASIGGSCIVHVIPDTYTHLGYPAFVIVVFGFFLPTILERITWCKECETDPTLSSKNHSSFSHNFFLTILMIGLSVHALLDGSALENTFFTHDHLVQDHDHGHLGIAILLHRLPEGFLIFDLLQRKLSIMMGWIGIFLISMATVLGYTFQKFDGWTILTNHEYHIHALVAGALCHVVSHHSFSKEDWINKRVWTGFIFGLVPILFL